MSMLNAFALATLNALAAHIALVDARGEIIAVNDTWRGFALDNAARSNVMEKANYITVCNNARGRDAEYAQKFVGGLKAVLAGECDNFALEYPCHSSREQRWFIGRISRFTDGNDVYAVVAHENITERKLAEEERYQQAKEAAFMEERQRISRELHDGVNQSLFSSMSIAQGVPHIFEKDPARAFSLLTDVVQLNKAALAEMRVLLNELRPDSIISTSLPKLFRQLADTITHRVTGTVVLLVHGDEFPLSPEVHFEIYRITQEALTNILKHSQAQHIEITLNYGVEQVSVCIEDDGAGFDMQTTPKHIGLNTMRERTEKINAQFDITSTLGQGTRVSIVWTNFTS